MAYSGTLIIYGQGTGIVVATGTATEIGRISGLIAQVEPLTTPLLRQMARFARMLTGAILTLAALTLAFGVLIRDYGLGEMFLAAVGLAAAAVPEGLPAVLTVTLAIGVERMARRHAIVRRLPAVETLGSVTVICSDKTGTVTKNEMTVRSIACGDDVFEVSGVGYDPHGAFRLGDREVQPRPPASARGDDQGVGAVQGGDTSPDRGRPLGHGRRPDRGRAVDGRHQSRAEPRPRARGVPAHGHDPVRGRTPVHGHLAPRPRRARLHLPQGRP
jgi:magnesium-transporting ATPase (P-type)